MNQKTKWLTEVAETAVIATNPHLPAPIREEGLRTFERLWYDRSAPVEWHKEFNESPFGVLIDVIWRDR